MKNGIALLIQAVLLIVILAILIDGLIRLPDIETVHIVIRAIWTIIVSINFSYTLYLYLSGK